MPAEDIYEPASTRGLGSTPLDSATFRHAPECEDRDTTDPKFLRAILTVTERESYWFVQCRTCDCGWQVPYYASASGGL
jgi:hypothetical protein